MLFSYCCSCNFCKIRVIVQYKTFQWQFLQMPEFVQSAIILSSLFNSKLDENSLFVSPCVYIIWNISNAICINTSLSCKSWSTNDKKKNCQNIFKVSLNQKLVPLCYKNSYHKIHATRCCSFIGIIVLPLLVLFIDKSLHIL